MLQLRAAALPLPEALLLPAAWQEEYRPRAAVLVLLAVRAVSFQQLAAACLARRAVDLSAATERRPAERQPVVSSSLRRRAAVLPAQVSPVVPASELQHQVYLAALFDRQAADHREVPSAWKAGWSARVPPSGEEVCEALPPEAACASAQPPAVARTSAREAAAVAAQLWALPEEAAVLPVAEARAEEAAPASVQQQEEAAEAGPGAAQQREVAAGVQRALAVVLRQAAVRGERAAQRQAVVPWPVAVCSCQVPPAVPARRQWNRIAPGMARLRIASP